MNWLFIIDRYNKYDKNSNVKETFSIFIAGYLEKWCIREIQLTEDLHISFCGYIEEDPMIESSKIFFRLKDAKNAASLLI